MLIKIKQRPSNLPPLIRINQAKVLIRINQAREGKQQKIKITIGLLYHRVIKSQLKTSEIAVKDRSHPQ